MKPAKESFAAFMRRSIARSERHKARLAKLDAKMNRLFKTK